jgi:hypothetical protein
MTFFSAWQPLDSEDSQTALVFGFLRHASVDDALQPWLTETLGRGVRLAALTIANFWPSYVSEGAGHARTVPELVFRAEDDNGEFVVVVEAKRMPADHDIAQLAREAVDAARATEATRLAVIMVGPDIGPPAEVEQWRTDIHARLEQHASSQGGLGILTVGSAG